MPNPKDIFELLSADLQAVGIKVDAGARSVERGYLDAEQLRHSTTCTSSAGPVTTTTPDNFIGTFFGRPRPSGATTTPSCSTPSPRPTPTPTRPSGPRLRAGQREIMECLPGVPIWHSPPAIVLAKDVTGLTSPAR